MKTLLFSVSALVCGMLWMGAPPAFPQTQSVSPQSQAANPIYREQARIERKLDEESRADAAQQPRPRRIDKAEVQRDAEELSELARSVSAEVTQTEQGMLPKDLSVNLKKIQKLSKRLRSELAL